MVLYPSAQASPAAFPTNLFGYQQTLQSDTAIFGQWVQALERHILIDVPEGDCSSAKLDRCHLRNWLTFLESLKHLPRDKQLEAVNRYANNKPYVLDIDNYGIEDYWAVPKEFLYNNGDCEDYAITKMFSLLWLGFDQDSLRIVVLQDTNLRIPHAVLAVADHDDILILDNQTSEVISHRKIVHYAPVYSINESHWWIHLSN
ncbi:transglutaminase-like cysteine proteinase BTLCP [Thiogranum longum]|uniref:Transglutaminase-like cysteine proteinase BTLCP n=2 Tax=Thiogranum longum TaxID=1537524 RepID=A0A4R1H751_9GAMM|nr:transglutaminase-like cysteine proteinase BTLCP [Thiogranum longum]